MLGEDLRVFLRIPTCTNLLDFRFLVLYHYNPIVINDYCLHPERTRARVAQTCRAKKRRMTAIPNAAHTSHRERAYASVLPFFLSVFLARTHPRHKVPYQLALKSSTKLPKAHL